MPATTPMAQPSYSPVSSLLTCRPLSTSPESVSSQLFAGKFVDISSKQCYMNEMFKEFLTKVDFGARPTKYALCTTLNVCAKTLNWYFGLQFHGQIFLNGYKDNCNRIEDARRIFSCMKQHDQVSWTSIIFGYAQCGYGVEAFFLFKNMLKSDIKPNCFTYVGIIKQCMLIFPVSSLIDFYSKCGRVDGAALLFDATTSRDNILYKSMIVGYCQNFYCEDALKLLT
ncbi:hypothetical protein Cgig2_020333 [Carnegiea gigantea]|uniref:Pentatricopeptide repeat-containing protein n=1 Tax=Carnegiea gigantea TaxID=171969 RepID=A0A9Q1QG90_9CARY|nr:hypothetical protein Cgig2_020333 [Carnegiea gigantea]